MVKRRKPDVTKRMPRQRPRRPLRPRRRRREKRLTLARKATTDPFGGTTLFTQVGNHFGQDEDASLGTNFRITCM